MNTQEFAEWLRGHLKAAEDEAERLSVENQNLYKTRYARGYLHALADVQRQLTSLDSSHDLPSTNG